MQNKKIESFFCCRGELWRLQILPVAEWRFVLKSGNKIQKNHIIPS